MSRIMTRILGAASLGLGLGFATPARVDVPCYPPKSYAPTYPYPQQRYYQPCPPVVVPYTPSQQHPSDLPKPEPGTQPAPGTQPSTAAPTAPTAPTADAAADIGGAGGGGGGMLGRGDQNQRFNLFDHMSAIPRTRAWFGFQYMQDYSTGLAFTSSFASFVFSEGLTSDPAVQALN